MFRLLHLKLHSTGTELLPYITHLKQQCNPVICKHKWKHRHRLLTMSRVLQSVPTSQPNPRMFMPNGKHSSSLQTPHIAQCAYFAVSEQSLTAKCRILNHAMFCLSDDHSCYYSPCSDQEPTTSQPLHESKAFAGMTNGPMGQMPGAMADPRPGPVQQPQPLRVCQHHSLWPLLAC